MHKQSRRLSGIAGSRRQVMAGLLCAAASTAAGGLLRPPPARAEDYPSRPLQMIVPFAPGGSTDLAARIIAQKLGELLGRVVVVENKAGGGTVVGTRTVAKAEPDGYTLLYGSNTLALNPTLRHNLPYDTLRDLQPIGMVARQPFVLVVNPALPVKSVQELVDYAKARPGAVNFGSAGIGTGNHLVQELFAILSGTQLQHVPYPGDGPMVTDLLAGRVQMTISTIPSLMTYIQSGGLRALGVGDADPLPQLPDVPPISKAGVPGYVATGWNALLAPGGTPSAVVERLTTALRQALADPKVSEALNKSGAVPAYEGPQQMTAYLNDEIKRWGEVIKARHIELD